MISEILPVIQFFVKIYISMKLSANEILNKFSKNTTHPFEVKRLALMLFDETSSKIHEMKPKYRDYLEAAALLHDIGYHIDAKGHNKHSMKMVLEHGLAEFSEQETKIIACVCRYHRGSLPDKEEHEIYNTFDKKERKIVKRLAGILKIADGLEKGHLNLIKELHINYDEQTKVAEIILTPNISEYLPDITDAIRKRDLYEIAFKCQTILKFI